MHKKQMSWVKLLCISCAFVAVFIFASLRVNQRTQALKDQREDLSVTLSRMEAEKRELENELSQVGSDAYIEDKARSNYQFLKPGEIRFEITNPDALYGTAAAESAAETSAQAAP